MNFQIGEKVKWQVGRIKATGCFLEHLSDTRCTVIVHTVNGLSAPREIEVEINILKV